LLNRYAWTSLRKICNAVYPGIIQPWELRHYEVSDYFWNDIKNRKKAVKWLIHKKLKLNQRQA